MDRTNVGAKAWLAFSFGVGGKKMAREEDEPEDEPEEW